MCHSLENYFLKNMEKAPSLHFYFYFCFSTTVSVQLIEYASSNTAQGKPCLPVADRGFIGSKCTYPPRLVTFEIHKRIFCNSCSEICNKCNPPPFKSWIRHYRHCFSAGDDMLYGANPNILYYPNTTGKSVIGEVLLGIEGKQGRIGSTNWSVSAAKVVCRMLNMEGAHVVPVNVVGGSIIPRWIWMDKVECSGNEKSILDCVHPGLRNKRQMALSSASNAVVACGKPQSKRNDYKMRFTLYTLC